MPPGDTVADPPGVGETLADSDALGAGDELTTGVPLGDTVGDMTADGVAVGVALADAGAEAGTAGAAFAAGAVLGADVAGAEVAAGEVTRPEDAWPKCVPGIWCAEAARARPPAADAASRPTTSEAIVSGRASRR